MDDLTLFKSLRSERAEDDPVARAEAWRALEDRFDAASAPAPSAPVATRPRRRRHLLRRRRLVVFAGATAAAAALAGVLVFGSGPTAQPAAAEILHRTAAVAASPDAPTASPLPGPGQFLYRKLRRVELESWLPGAGKDQPAMMMGGTMPQAGAFTVLMPTTQEEWLALDGAGGFREVAGTPQFLTSEERSRWEAAGSQLPPPFNLEYQRQYPQAFADGEAHPGVVESEHGSWKNFHFPDTSSLPTDPEALRLAVEGNQIQVSGFNLMYPSAQHLDAEQSAAELLNVLQEGTPMTPQLRAAIFNALAEIPGVEVDTEATDSLGRQGYAIGSVDAATGNRLEYVFDPDTAELLAQRDVLGKPGQGAYLKGVRAGLTVRETDYLETAVVDSTGETGGEG
jgi:hypothetical protein